MTHSGGASPLPFGHTRPGAAFDGSHAERGNHHEKYGSIVPLPYPHSAPIDEAGSAAWLDCMAQAIARQDYAAEFAEYLLQQLYVPAQRIVQASHNRHGGA